jgi:hypothetical protein
MTRLGQKARHYIRWAPILVRAAAIVREIEAATGIAITLRKLFYKLVSELLIPNDLTCYNGLSRLTGVERKAGTFPQLSEDKVAIDVPFYFDDLADGFTWLRESFALYHAKTQKFNILIACEKAGTVPFLKRRFWEDSHIRIIPLGGEASITTWQQVKDYIRRDRRPVLILYLGDYDASGFAIRSRFRTNLGLTDEQFIHVGLTREQVDHYRLPRNPGKVNVARKDREAFVAEVGEHVQVEVDALDEAVACDLVEAALAPYWNEAAYQRQRKVEAQHRRRIAGLLDRRPRR